MQGARLRLILPPTTMTKITKMTKSTNGPRFPAQGIISAHWRSVDHVMSCAGWFTEENRTSGNGASHLPESKWPEKAACGVSNHSFSDHPRKGPGMSISIGSASNHPGMPARGSIPSLCRTGVHLPQSAQRALNSQGHDVASFWRVRARAQ